MEVCNRRLQGILGSGSMRGRYCGFHASKYNSDVRGRPGLSLEGARIDSGGQEVVQCRSRV